LSCQYPNITDVRCILNDIKKKVRIKAKNYFLQKSEKCGYLTTWHMVGKFLKKFKLYVRFIGKIIILWNNSKKKLYKTGGDFDNILKKKERNLIEFKDNSNLYVDYRNYHLEQEQSEFMGHDASQSEQQHFDIEETMQNNEQVNRPGLEEIVYPLLFWRISILLFLLVLLLVLLLI